MRHGSTDIVVERWEGDDPTEAVSRLRGRPGLAWIDSALADSRYGRWSLVASDPRWALTAKGAATRVAGDAPNIEAADPLALLAHLIEAEAVVPPASTSEGVALPFAGGAIGLLAFEAGRYVERLPVTTVDDGGSPGLAWGWYDAALCWDGNAGRGWLVGRPEAVGELRARLSARIVPPRRARVKAGGRHLVSNFTRADYLDAVERARKYIAAGDIYQVNLSQRFTVRVDEDGLDLYCRLREASPAPFAAYLDFRALDVPAGVARLEVLSSSPERLLLIDGDRLETRPIKGTRPRGRTPETDACLAEELRASVKDSAEHVMIVDLERNDLGRVSAVGTVRVEALAALETYANVHHLTSTIAGQRRPDASLEDVLRAVFPGGSISGAPKIRAMQIIDELEPTERGVYTGSIGYISACGHADLNIAIRTITLADGIARFQVGGAIVHDSTPEAEYRETLDKARGMAQALGVRLPDEVPAAAPL